MKYVTSQQMMEIDKQTIEKFGIPSIVLMENAGRSAAEVSISMLKNSNNKKATCICGKGNNAGDGFVCARHLVNKGIDAEIFLIGDSFKLKPDAKLNFNILEKMKVKIKVLKNDRDFKFLKEELKKSQLIIDAIFGIGLSGEVKPPYSIAIDLINQSKKFVLAIDVPSGLDATTGKSLGACIMAKKTVTFGLPKAGFTKNDGPLSVGELDVVDISIPNQLLK